MNIQPFEFKISIVKKDPNEQENIDITLNKEGVLFVLGANGTGKSALMHWLNTQEQNAIRILSHRQATFPAETFDIQHSDEETMSNLIKNFQLSVESRYSNQYETSQMKMSMSSFVTAENILNRDIAKKTREIVEGEIDNQLLKEFMSDNQSMLFILNNLLKTANLNIKIFADGDKLGVENTKITGSHYSIMELSDGERNALGIACDVLTAPKDNLIIIDEPERHLHRSIISPFLSALFAERKDCSFIISTHEVYLPIDNPTANVLLVRGCEWESNQVSRWDANLLEAECNIPDDVKKQILGPKRKILFVEGKDNSLDKQLYQVLYEGVTVIPVGSCAEVEQRVKAMQKIGDENNLHWLGVYGVIDGDGQTAEHKSKLKQDNIVALSCYSVESLYYRTEIVQRAAKKYISTYGEDAKDVHQKAYSKIAETFTQEKDNLCARKIEQAIRDELIKSLPTWKDIKTESTWEQSKDIAIALETEKKQFDELISAENWDALIDRYPVKNSGILAAIAFPFGGTHSFQNLVSQLVREDKDGIKAYYKTELLRPLTELIEDDTEQSALA